MSRSTIVGNIVKLVKDCRVRGTKAGQWAVLTKVSSESGGVDLMIFEKEDDARDLVRLLRQENVEAAAMAAAEGLQAFKWENLSAANLRAVHVEYKKDFMTPNGLGALPPMNEEIVGKKFKSVQFTEFDEDGGEVNISRDVIVAASTRDGCVILTYDGGQLELERAAAITLLRAEGGQAGGDDSADAAVPHAWARRTGVVLAAMTRSAAMRAGYLSARDVAEVASTAGLGQGELPGDEAGEMALQAAGARALVAMEDAIEAGVTRFPTVVPPIASAMATPVQFGARLRVYLAKVGGLALRPTGSAGLDAALVTTQPQQQRAVRFADTGAEGTAAAPITCTASKPAPRYEALRKRAETEEVWQQCEKVLVEMAESDTARHGRIMQFEHMRRGAVERYLKSFGQRADPLLLAGAADLCAGELLEFVAELEAASRATQTEGRTQSRTGTNIQVLQPDVTGTEREQRERSELTEAALRVSADDKAYSRLLQMEERAVARDSAGVQKLVAAESDASLRLLLLNGEEVKRAIAGRVEAKLEGAVLRVRGVLDARMERAVSGSSTAVVSERVRGALRHIRLGRLHKVRLLHLLDKEDSGTLDHPLAGIAAAGAEAGGLCEAALGRLAFACAVAQPAQNSQALEFFQRLGAFVRESRTAGIDWKLISTLFVRPLLARVAQGAERFAVGEAVATACVYDVAYVTEPSDYLRDFERASGR